MPEDKTEKVKESLQGFWHKLAVGDEQNPAWLTTFWKMLRVFWRKLTIGDDQHKPLASNPVVVVLSLLFLFPVGVWFLFWFTNWNKKVQWSLVAFCGLVFLFQISGGNTNDLREKARETQRIAEARKAAEANAPPKVKKETNAVNRAGESVDQLTLPVGRGDALEAATLRALWSQNQFDTENKYKGKILVVQGPVHAVRKSSFMGFGESLVIDVGNRAEVSAFLSTTGSKNEDLPKLRTGDWVQVKGLCEGDGIGGILMKNCEFVLYQ